MGERERGGGEEAEEGGRRDAGKSAKGRPLHPPRRGNGEPRPAHPNCQPACKPGSVWRALRRDVAAIHLGRIVAARLVQPTRAARPETALRRLPAATAPIRSCSRWGLPCRSCCQARGGLLPHPFTLAPRFRRKPHARRFAFCGTFPGVAPAGRYPAPCFHGARTFLHPFRQRPSGRLALLPRRHGGPGQGDPAVIANLNAVGQCSWRQASWRQEFKMPGFREWSRNFVRGAIQFAATFWPP